MAEIGRHIRDAASTVATRSVMNPLLWLCAILAVPSFVGAMISDEPYRLYFFFLGGLISLFALGAYTYFALRDPDRLQDEEYRLRDKALTIYGDSTSDGRPEIGQILPGLAVTPKLIEAKAKEARDE